MSKVVCILPTFNRKELCKKAILSVLGQTRWPEHFIVLDNGSSDGTLAAVKSLNRSGCDYKVIRSETNSGASGGMHFLAVEALKYNPDWIWYMDDDACAESTVLERMLSSKVAQKDDTAMLLARIVNEDGEWNPENRPAIFDEKKFEFNGIPENSIALNEPVEVNTGGYCGWLVRAATFKEFGFPNKDFFFWFDDIEYVVRVSRKKKVFMIPGAVIKHHATSLVRYEVCRPFSGALPKIPEQHLGRYFYWYRNWLWFGKQWLPSRKYLPFFLKHVMRGLAAPILLGQDKIGKRWKMVLTAAFDALSNRLGENRRAK